MDKKQTAVEWLVEQLRKNENIRWKGTPFFELSEQAKEMEKERMIGLLEWMNSVNQSDPMRLETDNDDIVEQYYNETYGCNK
jgi:hypothetical protein